MSRVLGFLLWLLLLASVESARAQPPSEFERGTRELDLARLAASPQDAQAHAIGALKHLERAHAEAPTWRSAAAASEAALLARGPTLAGAWYWLASDLADYSDAYLEWQRRALDQIFARRPSRVFIFDAPVESLRINGLALPEGSFDRALPFEPGAAEAVAVSRQGQVARERFQVDPKDQSTPVHLRLANRKPPPELAESELPARRGGPPPPSDEGLSSLQIVTIVATTTLATGIAVGGGYLLLGESNPRGIDTAEGVAVIVTELVLIGGGVTIAILSD